METIIIIGNGISGVTAARYIRKYSNHRIIIISAESKYFFSRTALMYVYMGHMKFEHTQPYENGFWEKNRIELIQNYVQTIDFEKQTLQLANKETLAYDKLILAVGSTPNKFGWKGQDLKGVQGLYSAQDLELLEENSKNLKRAVIVGGGLIGIELAEMLRSRKIDVTFLVRDANFWGGVLPEQEAKLITRHIKEHHVDLQLETELQEIVGDENERVSKVITSKGEEIECQLVGLTAGVRPNVDFLKNTVLDVQKGIVINRYLETNQKNVYAIGDCAEFTEPTIGRRAVEQVWYTGKMMGETVANTICGNRVAYKPGHWYNSAKFFDIEYQTYGAVFAKLQENEAEFYWEHPKGKICMHFIFNKNTRAFIGINNFGIRLRHHAFDKWLTEKQSIEHVLTHLKDANFDPEFYKQYEGDIIEKYNQENKTNLQVKAKSWNRILNFFN